MNILVMGGTYFLGKHIVSELKYRNHNVTLFNRSTFGVRNANDINKLKGMEFDCVIDISGYTQYQISTLIDVIRNTIPYYIFISSTASILGSDEYAIDKKESEEEIMKRYDKYLIMRPYYLCGDYDYTDRFDYSEWPVVYWKGTRNKVDYDDVSLFSKKVIDLMEDGNIGIYTRIDNKLGF